MISFAPSEEQSIAQSAAARLAKTALRPLSRDLSTVRGYAMARPLSEHLLDEIASLGVVQSAAHLGDGVASAASRVVSAIVLEELAWGDANCAVAVAASLAFVRAVADQGSERQKREILPLFEEPGHRAAAIAAAEPGLNPTGLSSLRTELVPVNDGHLLRGKKALVPYAGRCSHFIVVARVDGGLGAFIVPANAAGVTIEAARYTMGCAASEMSDVIFDDVVIAPEQRLGEGGGCDVQKLTNASWVATSAVLSGVARAAYEDIKTYVKERKVAGEVLATKQAVAIKIANMFTDSESMRWMGWRAAGQLDRGQDATRSARLAHGRAVDCAGWITDEALQFMGGHGFIAENLVESWYRNAKTISTFETALGV